MCTPVTAVQLALLEKQINEAIEALSENYPFLRADMIRAKKGQELCEKKSESDELALRTIREISESLAA